MITTTNPSGKPGEAHMFVWGDKGRVTEDAVTASAGYTCPKCPYQGRLLLYTEQQKRMAYFVPPMGGRRDFGGVMVCPACGNRFFLKKRRLRHVAKIAGGLELVRARQEIGLAIEHLVREAGQPSSSGLPARDPSERREVHYDLAGSTPADRDRLANALTLAGVYFRLDEYEVAIDENQEEAVDQLMGRRYDSIFLPTRPTEGHSTDSANEPDR